jgi:hypothetical protein
LVQFTLPKNSKITAGKVGAATNAYSTREPARQPISQKSVSSRVASLKIAISSASRAGVGAKGANEGDHL